MKRRFTAMLFGSLSLAFLACSGTLTEQPPPARTVGGFFAYGLSEKFNTPNEQGVSPCDGALHILNGAGRPSFVTLYKLDGNDWTCVGRFIEEHKDEPHEVRVYLSYDQVEHPSLLELHEASQDVRHQVGIRAADTTELSVVLALEDRLTDEEFRVFTMELERGTTITIERNPLDHDAESFGRAKEAHGRGPLCEGDVNTASQDGFLFSAAETLSWIHDNRNCERLILWHPDWQGLCVANGVPFKCVPVADRVIKISDAESFSQLAAEASL